MDSKKKTILGYVLSFGVLLLGSLLLAVACTPSHHNYVTRNGNIYYYNPPNNPNDPSFGVEQPELVAWMYLGEKDGLYAVATYINQTKITLTCRSPCTEARAIYTYFGRVTGDSTIHIFDGSPAQRVLMDAMAGRMYVFYPPLL